MNVNLPPLSPTSQALLDTAQQVFTPNYAPAAMIIDRGRGAYVWDKDNNEYIDLGAGISVSSFGHQHPEIVAALLQQAQKLWHTSNWYYTEPAIQLAHALVEQSFAQRVFLCSSGAEANEAAIKLVRKYASLHFPADKREIISFTGSFHGRTLATVTATAQPKYHQGFEPLPAGFKYCPFNDLDALTAAMSEQTCAVILEPVQGEGGIHAATPAFLRHVRALCDQHNALLILDEIQSGMGRTGKLFAYQWVNGLQPDIVTLAKALGNGFPVGALLAGDKAAEVFQLGTHGTTFGGNPMAAAVAQVTWKLAQSSDLLEHINRQGAVLQQALQDMNTQLNLFSAVRGKGLMWGAELQGVWENRALELVEICRQHGVLVLVAGGNVLRFLPPLTVTDEELQIGLQRLNRALQAAVHDAK